MFAGLRRAADAKKRGKIARLKSAPKHENRTYNHFTPIKGQASALADFSSVSFSSCYAAANGVTMPTALGSFNTDAVQKITMFNEKQTSFDMAVPTSLDSTGTMFG
jgi:hypothetical protein